MNEKFGKQYKLCSQKLIGQLFGQKKSIRCYPFILHYSVLPLDTSSAFQVVISAPKRTFKKAHDRNRIKRIVRESIRKNKLILEPYLEENGLQIAMFMIYTAQQEIPSEKLMSKTTQLFKQLIDELPQQEKTASIQL